MEKSTVQCFAVTGPTQLHAQHMNASITAHHTTLPVPNRPLGPHPCRAAPVNHLVQVQLGISTLQHALLHTAACHQPVYVDRLGLTNAMHTSHGLQEEGGGRNGARHMVVGLDDGI